MHLRHMLLGASLLAPVSANAALVIKAAPTVNVSCAAGICAATASDAVLNIKTLKTMLRNGDATVASGSLAQDVEIGTALAWTSTSTLTLDAARSVRIARPVAVQGAGGLRVVTNDGGTGGEFSFPQWGRVSFLDLSSSLVIDGHAYTLFGDLATLTSDNAADNGAGYYALAGDYDAGPDGIHSQPPLFQIKGVLEGLGNSIVNFQVGNPVTGNAVGLISYNRGTVRNLGMVDVAVTGFADGGALAYQNDGTISRVRVTGNVHVGNGGGLVMNNKGAIALSHSEASVEATGFAGGLAGRNDGTIAQSFATGMVSTGGVGGGLVSLNSGTVTASYSRGAVSGGAHVYSGGFVGMAYYSSSIAQTYETGAIAGGSVGGFAGQSSSNAISAAYWNQTTTGMKGRTNGTGDHKHTTGITPRTAAQMRSSLLAGFDPALWALDPAINGGFPYLLNNPR